jgi:hypothetical protein
MSLNLTLARSRSGFAVAALSLALAQAASARHKETVCPTPALAKAVGEVTQDVAVPGLTGTPLGVHEQVSTSGTNPYESPELFSDLIAESQTFGFLAGAGIVKGRVTQRVRRGADSQCKYEWQVAVAPDSAPDICVTEVLIAGVRTHGLDIVADYRDDTPVLPPPAPIRPLVASRPERSLFKFIFAKPGVPGICPGERSFPLLLNTSNDVTDKHGTVRLRVTGDSQSPPMNTYVPYP